MSNRERQAAFRDRQRKALADALAKVASLKARIEVLRRERDRFAGLVECALKLEGWAAARQRVMVSEQDG